MKDLKRDLIKYARDKAKSNYKKGQTCFICGSSDNLDFHHYSSMTELLNVWLKNNNYKPTTDGEIKDIRDQFIADHYQEIYIETVTLCHTHHLKLHSVYGKSPSLATAKKQAKWVDIQRGKNEMVSQGERND